MKKKVTLESRVDSLEQQVVELRTEMREGFRVLTVAIDRLTTNVVGLMVEMGTLKTEVAGLKVGFAELRTDVAELKTDVARLKLDVGELKQTVGRHDLRFDSMQMQLSNVTELASRHMSPSHPRFSALDEKIAASRSIWHRRDTDYRNLMREMSERILRLEVGR